MIRKIALAAALACTFPAHAVDGMSVELGHGDDQTDLWRVGLQWNWNKKWFAERRWNIVAYWDLTLGGWNNTEQLGDLGLTPTFRLQRRDPSGVTPYFEAAIGFHLLSELSVSRRRFFGSHFQFGDHLGAGLRFGERLRYDLSIRFQHLSDGGIKEPNPGINFLQLRFAYHFD